VSGGCAKCFPLPSCCVVLSCPVLCCAVLCCAVLQSLNKPVTDLMTRSTPTEVAAFANDPHYTTNNTAYKHMISQWG
jgi:hypothetical protein